MKYKIIKFSIIDSTNNEAKRIVSSGKAVPSVILAHIQTAGRGRYNRKWEHGQGNLYMSVLTPLECHLSKASELSFVIGLATYEVVDTLCNKIDTIGANDNITNNIKLKWPNDIFIGNHKLGGILLESITHTNQTWIIIGIGLNLQKAPTKYSVSLKDCGVTIKPDDILNMIIESFQKYKQMWSLRGFSHIRTLWLQHAYKLGNQVNVGDMNSSITGIFESIDETGAMILRLSSGETYNMSIGEMFF